MTIEEIIFISIQWSLVIINGTYWGSKFLYKKFWWYKKIPKHEQLKRLADLTSHNLLRTLPPEVIKTFISVAHKTQIISGTFHKFIYIYKIRNGIGVLNSFNDQPSEIIVCESRNQIEDMIWHKNGIKHRDPKKGPAAILNYGNERLCYVDGKYRMFVKC